MLHYPPYRAFQIALPLLLNEDKVVSVHPRLSRPELETGPNWGLWLTRLLLITPLSFLEQAHLKVNHLEMGCIMLACSVRDR
jgi:hypothetical protein